MKRLAPLLLLIVLIAGIAAGCSNKKENLSFNSKKNTPLPDYVLNSSQKVKNTYILASNYSKVLSQVPCYCGCGSDGHTSNLNCFIDKMGPNSSVQAWDQHGIDCDVCVDIANDAVQMHVDGKNSKDIYQLIKEKYSNVGQPTPTPEPK